MKNNSNEKTMDEAIQITKNILFLVLIVFIKSKDELYAFLNDFVV
jgi:hypothetical protein